MPRNRRLRKEGGTVENIQNAKEIIRRKVDNVAPKDDMAHNVATHLAMWRDDMGMHDDIEP